MFIYSFTFGCSGSLLLHVGFLGLKNILQMLFTASEFYIVICDSQLTLENEAMRSLLVFVYMLTYPLSLFLPLYGITRLIHK